VVTDDALRMSATSAASLAVNAAVAFISTERDALTESGRERARAVRAEVQQAAWMLAEAKAGVPAPRGGPGRDAAAQAAVEASAQQLPGQRWRTAPLGGAAGDATAERLHRDAALADLRLSRALAAAPAARPDDVPNEPPAQYAAARATETLARVALRPRIDSFFASDRTDAAASSGAAAPQLAEDSPETAAMRRSVAAAQAAANSLAAGAAEVTGSRDRPHADGIDAEAYFSRAPQSDRRRATPPRAPAPPSAGSSAAAGTRTARAPAEEPAALDLDAFAREGMKTNVW